jgi:hypothetical protein
MNDDGRPHPARASALRRRARWLPALSPPPVLGALLDDLMDLTVGRADVAGQERLDHEAVKLQLVGTN